ncbi:hypothetical protein CYY_004205 [Polysphondylium violaceum]|uniref:Hemerythrin-like domain-containing protein n=1 Tax=Polysphondylium violaceum TaxID=133409 RepID=A0A8J4PVN2_9MYCE|nr:hypothetical protein CYY_004205 [Polysphondylium violaceum]
MEPELKNIDDSSLVVTIKLDDTEEIKQDPPVETTVEPVKVETETTPTPVEEVIVETTPVPVEEVKVETTPAPVEEVKVEPTPVPVEEVKIETTPVPVEELKVESTPAPVEEIKVEPTPVPVEEVKIETTPAPVEEVKVETTSAPIEEVKVETTPAPVQETKVETTSTPVEEVKVEAPTQVETTPVVESTSTPVQEIKTESTSEAGASSSNARPENDMKQYFEADNFHLHGWLWAHISIKRVYGLVEKKLNKGFEPKNRKEVEEFVRAVQTVADYLHSHHDHEEDFVWAWIKEFDPTTEETLTLMDKQHNEWIEKNKELDAILTRIKETKTIETSASEGFKEIFDQLAENIHYQCDVIYSHFYDEERLLLPIALKISKEGQQKVGKMIHDRIQKESNKNFSLCCMIDTAKHDKVFADSFNNTLPWFVRKVIGGLLWKKEYKWFLAILEN